MSETIQEFFEGNDFNTRDMILLQSYMDGVFRLIILIYSLSLAALAFTQGFRVITLILSCLILTSLAYAFFTLATVGSVLLKIDGYNKLNVVFYYVGTGLLTLLFFAILFNFIKPLQSKSKWKL